MSWFEDLYPEVPAEFPPTLLIESGKTYKVTFKEKRPRLVVGGYGRQTAVINVEYEGEPRSLYVGSHVDLARQIRNIEKQHGSLKGLTVEIKQLEKRGRNYLYKVEVVHARIMPAKVAAKRAKKEKA